MIWGLGSETHWGSHYWLLIRAVVLGMNTAIDETPFVILSYVLIVMFNGS